MRAAFALLLWLAASLANSAPVGFAWDADPSYPPGVTYELQANECSQIGIVSTTTLCDLAAGPNGFIQAQVRAIAPPDVCGEAPDTYPCYTDSPWTYAQFGTLALYTTPAAQTNLSVNRTGGGGAMSITVDDTTIARFGSGNENITIISGSFTPPDNSKLVVVVASDHAGVDPNVQASGGGLTWSRPAVVAAAGGAPYQAILTADVATGASMQITLSRQIGYSGLPFSAKAYIITGQHASPNGTTGSGTFSTNSASPTLFTSTGAGRAFYGVADWDTNGLGTSTDVEDAGVHRAGYVTAQSVYKDADHAASQSVAGNIDWAGSGGSTSTWVAFEVLAADAGGASASQQVFRTLVGVGR